MHHSIHVSKLIILNKCWTSDIIEALTQSFVTIFQIVIIYCTGIFSSQLIICLYRFILDYVVGFYQFMHCNICTLTSLVPPVTPIYMYSLLNPNDSTISAQYDLDAIYDVKNIHPLTTNVYAYRKVNNSYVVFPASQSATLPFSNALDQDFDLYEPPQNNIKSDDVRDLNEDRTDYSELAEIDQDRNYLRNSKATLCSYHNELLFNESFTKQNNFSIFLVNIRSIPRNLDQLTFYLNSLNHTFSVIAISENWLTPANKDIYGIQGYTHHCVIRENRPGGGVSLYMKNNLTFKIIQHLTIPLEDVDVLFVVISKEQFKTSKNILIGICYRAPRVPMNAFLDEMHRLLEDINKLNLQTYLIGDFNINTLRSHTGLNKTATEFSNLLLSYFYYPLINKPTRVVNDSSSLIDNVYTNIAQCGDICSTGVLTTDFSDHYSIFAITNFNLCKVTPAIIRKRKFSNKNKYKFHSALKKQTWDGVYNAENINCAFQYFEDTFVRLFETYFPLVNVKITYSNKLPWITSGLRESVKKKSQLRSIMEKDPSPMNKTNYKKHRNLLTSMMRKRHKDYLEEQFEISNPIKKWKILKELINKTDCHKSSTPEIFINGSICNDLQTIVNAHNKYFVEVGPRLANNISSSINPMSYLTNHVDNSMYMPEITECEVITVICSLTNSSPGWDNIPAKLLKPYIEEYIKPLTYIINKSFETGVFLDSLKLAKVIPIYKSGDKTLLSNYRPISILNSFSKIFEKVIYNHLIDFIDKNNILYKFQFGFRKGYSTSHAIISLVEKINKVLSSGKIMVGVTLDFSKAFDTIQHPILLKKLFAYGIRGNILKLIESYLANRQQFVTINNSNSTQKAITCGVPQGSILGPLFFLLCISDLPNVSEKLFAILFADDTSVFLDGKDLAEITNTINAELAKLTVWLSANKLTLNTSKSHFMTFHRAKLKSSDTKIPVILSNTILEQVTFIKFLGVIIDNKLTFERHIVYTKNKISKGLGIITKARKYLNRETLLRLYNAFVFPYLTNCVEVWGTTPKKYLDPLIKIQKKIVRIITFSPYLCHTDPIFKDLNLLPISHAENWPFNVQIFNSFFTQCY